MEDELENIQPARQDVLTDGTAQVSMPQSLPVSADASSARWQRFAMFVVLGVGALVLCLLVLYIFWHRDVIVISPSTSMAGEVSDIPVPAPVSASSESNVTNRPEPFEFPQVSKQETVGNEDLPAELRFVILPAANDVVIQETMFENGERGFAVDYVIESKNLEDLHRGLVKELRAQGLTILNGSRWETRSWVDAEGLGYRFKFVEAAQGEDILLNITLQQLK